MSTEQEAAHHRAELGPVEARPAWAPSTLSKVYDGVFALIAAAASVAMLQGEFLLEGVLCALAAVITLVLLLVRASGPMSRRATTAWRVSLGLIVLGLVIASGLGVISAFQHLD